MAEFKKHSPHGEMTAMANAQAAEDRRVDDVVMQTPSPKDEDVLLRDLHANLLVYKHEKSNWRGKSPRGEKEVNEAHQKLLDSCVEYILHNTQYLEPEQIRALTKHEG